MDVAIELQGVDEVVEYRVESAGECRNRGEKRVAQPNGENGVFLAQGLSGGYGFAIAFADFSPDSKLKYAAYKSYNTNP